MNAHERAWLSLEGLAVGDTFGERFFGLPEDALRRIAQRELCAPPWTYTDDKEMTLSIVEVLRECGEIDQDFLAQHLLGVCSSVVATARARTLFCVPSRREATGRASTQAGFRGMGSFGNGAAMRVAPLGAFFADASVETVCDQARLSAEVTHCHPEGIAGGIAVAVATALAWRRRADEGPLGPTWIKEIRNATPPADTREMQRVLFVAHGARRPPSVDIYTLPIDL